MNLLKILALSLVLAHPAHADGPALAFITMQGRTLTLTAQNAPFAPPMIVQDGAAVHLAFADLHLRFPLPPFLDVTLTEHVDGWRVTSLHFSRPEDLATPILTPETAQVIEASGNDINDLHFVIEVDALAQTAPTGTAIIPVRIEITLTSP